MTAMVPGEGVLVLAATPIGDARDAAPRLGDELASADVIAAEDTRRLRRLCQALDVNPRGSVVSYHEHNEAARTATSSRDFARALASSSSPMPVCRPSPTRVPPRVGGRRDRRAGDLRAGPVGGAHGAGGVRAAGRPVLLRGVPATQGRRAGAGAQGARRRSTGRWCSSRRRTGSRSRWPTWRPCSVGTRRAAVCRELTKTYEEVRRGSPVELVAWADDGVKGEITVVVAGADVVVGRRRQPAHRHPRPGRRGGAAQGRVRRRRLGDRPVQEGALRRGRWPPSADRTRERRAPPSARREWCARRIGRRHLSAAIGCYSPRSRRRSAAHGDAAALGVRPGR